MPGSPKQSPLRLIPHFADLKKLKNIKDSYKRSVKKINEYILANEFDLFVTITYDPRRLRNYTPQGAQRLLQVWLYRQTVNSRNHGKELKYIVFPDVSENKDLLEFHVLLSGYTFSLKRSGIIVDGTLAYTIKAFVSGFTKARSLSGYSKEYIFNVVLPYLNANPSDSFHGRRYWPSRTLDEVEVYENNVTRFKASYNLDAINALGTIETAEKVRQLN